MILNRFIPPTLSQYRKHRMRELLLEEFVVRETMTETELKEALSGAFKRKVLWNGYSTDIAPTMLFLLRIGYIVGSETDSSFIVTDLGRRAVKKGTISKLAIISYRNYLNARLQVIAILISALAFVAGMSSIMMNIFP